MLVLFACCADVACPRPAALRGDCPLTLIDPGAAKTAACAVLSWYHSLPGKAWQYSRCCRISCPVLTLVCFLTAVSLALPSQDSLRAELEAARKASDTAKVTEGKLKTLMAQMKARADKSGGAAGCAVLCLGCGPISLICPLHMHPHL